jgi:hypothetical protein
VRAIADENPLLKALTDLRGGERSFKFPGNFVSLSP